MTKPRTTRNKKPEESFQSVLGRIIEKLKNAGTNTQAFEEKSWELGPRKVASVPDTLAHGLRQGVLARLGKDRELSLAHLRIIVETCECYTEPKGPLKQSDIDDLITASPFTEEDLARTSHEVIAKAASSKKAVSFAALIKDIRSASDIGVAKSELPTVLSRLPHTQINGRTIDEIEKGRLPKNAKAIEEIIELYNTILFERGNTPFTPDEIATVMDIYRKDVARTPSASHAEDVVVAATQESPAR